MSENNNKKYISFLTKISRKIHPRFSLHYAVYSVLFLFLTFSIVGIVTATTPNPGHPWTEVGDGNVIFSDPGAARTYTLPTVNATLLSTGIGLSGGTTLIGGTATTDQLILRSTSGAGTTGADIIFQTGNNGATEVGRFLNNGKFKLTQYGSGTNTGTATYSLQVDASGNVIEGSAATGVTALSAIGSSPNANGATITGSTLNLEPASASFGGVVTTGSQTFAGAKVFNSTITTGTTGTAGSVTFNRSSDGTSMGTIAASSAYLTLNGTTGIELGGTSTNGVRITSAGTWIGRASISNANPTAFLTLAAGTSAASSAPLKFTPGTNLSSAEAGAVEWDGTQFYLTSSVPTRNIIAQVSGATALSTGAVYATTNGYLTSTAPTSGAIGYWSRSGTTLSPATANDIVTLSSTNLSSGSLLDISVNSTAAASNTQKVINISTTGTNGTAGQTTYGGYFANTHDGSTSTNIGAYFTASGGTTTNWSAFFNERINVGNATNDANHALIVRSLDNTANHGIKITANNQTTSMEIGYNTISTGGGLILSPGTTTGLQVSGSGAFMYVGGAVTPTARVHIAAGTATAGQAPLKFTSGTNLSSAEAGAVEWDGTQLYLTSSVPTRNIVAQVAGATALSTGAVYATTNGYLTSTAPTSGTLGYWSRSGTTLSPATANDIVTVSTNSTTASNKAIEALQTGATSGTDYAAYFSNTGAATTNVGLYATATGGTNNYAAIFENGRVGIGTATPTDKLYIIAENGQTGITIRQSTNGGANEPTLTLAHSTTGYGARLGIIDNDGSFHIDVQNNSNYINNALFIKSASGNVGIQTTTPLSLFEVNQPSTGPGTVTTNGTTTLTGSGTNFTTTFRVGSFITVSGETARVVSSIASDTSLTVTSAFSTSASGLSYTVAPGRRFAVGDGQVFIGTLVAGRGNDQSGTSTVFGVEAMRDSIGIGPYQNDAFGFSAMRDNITGRDNAAFGAFGLRLNQTGNENVAVGRDAIANSVSGSGNTSVGVVSLYDLNASGSYNTAVGNRTGRGITTGSYNTIIGAGVNGLSSSLSNTVIIADGQANYRFYSPSTGNVLFGTTTDAGAYKVQIEKATTGQTAQARVLDVRNAGATFDTTAGALSSYGGYFSSTSTRSAGSNDLTNVGLYVTASGAQQNFALETGSGNVKIGVLDTDLTAPSTSGTTKMVITDANGQLSFANIFSGTVTDFIFTDGNGFDGTVTTSTSTPTLSLTTTVSDTQVMFSNSGAITGDAGLTYNSGADTLSITGGSGVDGKLRLVGRSNDGSYFGQIDLINKDGNYSQIYTTISGISFITNNGTTERLTIGRDTELIINEPGNDYDFRVESDTNANAFTVDAGLFSGVGAIGLGGAGVNTAAVSIIPPAFTSVANTNIAGLRIAPTGITVPTGTTNVASTLHLVEPVLTATGTITNAATLYIENAPTEGSTTNYALFVDSGAVRFDGNVNLDALSASSAVYTDGSKNLTTTAPTSGTIGYWSRSGTTLSPATANDILSITGNTGDLLTLTSSATGSANKALNISQTGATSGTDYAGYFSNTGAATTNVGLYATATGATNNYAAIFENGNVGIGTTAPSFKLEVSGAANTLPLVISGPTADGEYGGIGFSAYATGGTAKSALVKYRTTSYGIGDLVFLNDATVDASSADLSDERMRITASGNVGIGGDTTPDAMFSVGSTSQFQVNSSGNILGVFANATTDTDRFLVSDSGTIKYRTGAEILSDIGAQASGNYITALTGDITATGPGSVAATIANDVIDWADIIDSMTVDAATDINLGANALSIDLDSTGDFSIRDVTTDVALFSDDGSIVFSPTGTSDITLTLDDNSQLIGNATITNTSSLFDLNLTLGDDGGTDTVSALNIDVTSMTPAGGDLDDALYALNIENLSSASVDVDERAIRIGSGWDTVFDINGTYLSYAEVQALDNSGSSSWIRNQTGSDQTGGFRINGNGIFNGGEVLIGSTTDYGSYKLQVTGEQYIQTPAGQTGITLKQVSGGGAGNEPTISFSHNTSGYGSRIGMRDSDGGLHFDVQNASTWLDNALVIESGTGDIGIGAGTNPLYRLDVLKATTGQTASNRVANFSNAGATFNTTSGALSSYGGYFSSTSTRSAGANALTNIGLYATASGAQNNYAAIFDAGNVGIGTTAPLMKLDITNGTQVTGANQDNPTVLNITGANNTLTGGAATAYIVSNTAQAADTGGSIAFSGLTITGDNDSVNNWAIIKGAKENSTTANQEGYLTFAVRNHAAGNVVERMRINSAGELQIGSTTDLGAYKLQVTGDTDQAGDFYSTSSGTIKAKIASSNGLISAGPGGINIARSDVSTIGVSDASITYSSADIVLVNKNLAVSGGVYGTSSYSISTNNITIGYDMISASTNAGTGDSYRFDTAGAQTAGNLLNLKNNTTSKFSVDYNGAITSASLTSGGTQCLQANSSGVISGTGSACGSGGVTNWDTIGDPSAGADINFGTTAQTITSTATTQNPLSLIGNSLTTGSLFSLTSTSTALTSGGLLNISATGAPASSWTGSLGLIEYNNADVDVDGSALKLGLKGAAGGEGTTLNITTEQTGTNALALRVNDDGTYTDSTPFVINASGNVGINSTAPQYLLHVGAGTDASDAGSTMLAIFENAGSSSISIRDAANNSEAYIYADSGGVNFGSVTNHPVQIGAGTGTSIFIDTSNNVNIGGDITPNSLFTVGGSSEFQVNSSGAIVAATGITSSGTITFSGLSTTGIVHNNSSGVLSTSLVALGDLLTQGTATDEFCLTSETGGGALLAWQACGGGAPAWDTITAPTTSNLSLAHGAFTTDFTFNSVTTATAFALSSSSLTTGKLFDLSSSSTTLTTGGLLNITHSGVPGSSWTGDLAKIESTGASTANLDGNLLKLGYTGTAGASDGTVLNITSTQTGSSSYLFRANDDGTYTDSTPFVVDANGQIGVQTTSLSDYLVSLTGTTSNDNSRVLDITQANDAAEDSFGIALNITSNPGTLTGVTRNVRGISNTVNPTATIGDESEFFVNGIQVSTSSSNVTFNAAPGGNTSTFRGILAVSSGSPTINISSGTDTTIESSGVFGSSGLTPVLTSVSATTVLNSYGGRFSDSTSTAGDANLTVTAYGVQGQTFGNLTTTGTTTHYGGYFNATGTADTNYGIYATATSGTTNYAGYFVGDVSVTGHILPGTNDTYDLGSDSLRWRDLYLGGETLHLGTSTTDEGTIAYTTSSNILNFGTDSTSNGDISFFTDDLYLDKSAARVGINTTGPGASLHITQNTASADATLVIEDTNGANDVRMQFRTPADTGTGFSGIARGQVLYAIGHGASGASGWADYEGRPLIFYTGCDDLVCNAVAERMRIIQTGEVNIGGDATPNAMFTVGSTSQFQVNSSGAIAAATGIISSGTIQFSALTTNGAVYTSGGNGTLTTTAPTSGAIGYWSRATTTLSPTTANDIVSIPTTNTTGADLAITNTGVYTGTGIFNLTANSATTGALASITGNGLTSGSLLSLSSNGAAAANGQKGLSVTLAGNIGTSITTYAGYFDNSHTRTAGTPLNVGVYGNATSGGADNYGVYGSATGGNVNAAGFFTNDGDGYNPTTIVTNSSTATNGYTQMAIRGGQEWTVGVGNTNETALGLASKFFVYYPFGGIVPLTIDTSGNVGIGDTTPSAMFSVGATSQFQVNSSGAIAAATGITMTSGDIITSNLGVNYTDSDTNPGCAAGEYKIFADTSETKLKKCTNGTVTDMDTTGGGGTAWSDITVPTGNLTLAMDADLTTFNYDTLTTQNAFTLASTSITSGTLFNLTSTSTAVTSAGLLNIQATGAPAASWTGDLAKIEYNNADADVDGTALKLGLLGAAAGDGTTLNITNQQTGTNALALRVNDDGTYTDSTPFVVDVAGNVGIKTTSATSTLTVAGNAEFTTSGTSGFTFTNATASSSSGVLRLNATSSSDFVSSARFSTTQTATGSLTASYGLQNFWTSTAVVAGASVGQTTYGIFNAASKSGADTATGTYNLYASYNTADNTGRTDAGTVNTYGGYFSTLGDTAGASTAYGIYATASGADNNYAGIFANGNVGVGDATPTSLFTVGASDAFQVNSSGAITAATGVTSSGVIAANGGITVATGQQIGASNFGIEFAESDTNPTCAAGNFNIYADLSENKLKKCTNGTVTDLDTTGGGGLSDADYGDIVVSSSGTVMSIDADVIDWADISDTTTLDASTSIAFGASTFGLTFTNNGSGNETHNLSSTGDFVIQDNGVSALTVDDGGSVTLGQASTDTGQLVFANSSNGNTVTIQAGATSGSYTWTLPTADAAGCLKSDGAGTMSIGSCGDAKSEIFTANGNYTMPSDARIVIVDVIGGGGGGGGGGRNAAGTTHTGGGGGGGGAYATRTFSATAVSSPVTITVPAGATGGVGSNANGSNGNQGAIGTNVSFGSLLTGYGGGGGGSGKAVGAAPATGGGGGGGTGAAGSNGSTTGGAGGLPLGAAASAGTDGFAGGGGGTGASAGGGSMYGGGGGGGTNNNGAAAGSAGGTSYRGGGGGGGGGGATAANAGQAGGAGGKSPGTANSGGGGAAGAANNAGTAGANAGTDITTGANGGGGGGGGGGTTGAGGAGGNGGVPGGGGGGGGSGTAANGGNGGAGGRGQVQVWTIRGAGAADLAETYPTNEADLGVADVVVFDPELPLGVKRSTVPYDRNAVGIVSTTPNMVMGGEVTEGGVKSVPIGLSGRVPVRVTSMNGPIKPGDYLTTSSLPGVAMKATKAGTIIGRSLGTYTGGNGENHDMGIVIAFIQNGYYNGESLVDVASVPGLEPDIGPPVDFSKKLLGKLVSDLAGQDDVSLGASPLNVSDLYIDKLAAAIEIVTPSVVTNKLSVDNISPSMGKDIGLMLGPDGKFTIGSLETTTTVTNPDGTETVTIESSPPTIIFDSLGNATFAGTLTAKEIKIGDVSAIEEITEQINTLAEGQVAFTLTAQVMNTLSTALTLAQADILKLQTDMATTSESIAGLTTSGTDIDTRLKIVEGFLTKDADGVVNGFAINMLSVSGDSAFAGKAQFDGLSFFSNTTSFTGGVTFAGQTEFLVPPLYNKDSAGYALIKEGDKKVQVTFSEPYIATPVVNTSITFEEDDSIDDTKAQTFFTNDIRFIIVGKNQNGFTILLNKQAPRDIRFSWNALSVKDPSIFESVFEGLVIEPTLPTPEGDGTPTDNVGADPTTEPDETPAPDPIIEPDPTLPTPEGDGTPTDNVGAEPAPEHEEAPQPEGGVI